MDPARPRGHNLGAGPPNAHRLVLPMEKALLSSLSGRVALSPNLPAGAFPGGKSGRVPPHRPTIVVYPIQRQTGYVKPGYRAGFCRQRPEGWPPTRKSRTATFQTAQTNSVPRAPLGTPGWQSIARFRQTGHPESDHDYFDVKVYEIHISAVHFALSPLAKKGTG